MALPDDLQATFAGGGFDLSAAVRALTEAYSAVAPAGPQIDVARLTQLAGGISGTDPAAAFAGVAGLATALEQALGGLGSGADLIASVTRAGQSLTAFGAGSGDLRTSLVTALTASQPGERPVDRFAAGTEAIGALPIGPLGDALRLLAPGALPQLPPTVTGWAAPIAQVGGLPALATQLGLLLGGSTAVATANTLAEAATELADPGPIGVARAAVLALDGAALATLIASGGIEDDVVAGVTAGLAALFGFVDAVNAVLIGGVEMLGVLDPAPLETLLNQAIAAAATADTGPVHSLAEAVAGQLSIVLDLRPTAAAAAGVDAFATTLADQVAPLVAAVEGVDLAKVAAPVHDAVESVLVPIRTVTDALRTAVADIKAVLERIRTTVESLGLDAVEHAVHTVIDPVVHIVNQVRQLLEPIAQALGPLATQASREIAQLRTTLDGIVGEIAAAFQALATAVDALQLDQFAGLRSAMDEVAATIEGISIATAADEAVGFIEGAAEVISAIPFDLLPEGARAEASSALAPLKQIDFNDDVAQPLGQTMSEVLAEVEGPTLDDIIQAFAQVTAFLAEIDPRPGLAEIEREGFGAFVEAVQAIDPDAILAPVREALSGLSGLKDLLKPADEAFARLLAGLDELDPAPLLDPVAADVDEARAQIQAALQLDRWSAEVTAAADRLHQVIGLVHLTNVVDLPLLLLNHLWPATGAPDRGLPGAQLVAQLFGPAVGPLDVLSFSFVADWLGGQRGPAADLAAAAAAARSALTALRAQVLALDPTAVLPTVGSAFNQVAAAVAALPASPLRERLAPLVARRPLELLQTSIAARGELLARLDTTGAILDRIAALAAGGLAALVTRLRAALAPLTDAIHDFAVSWTARAGADPGSDLRAALAAVFTACADKLRPELAALETAIVAKLDEAVEVAIRAPLGQAATDVGALVATIDLRPLTGEVEQLFADVRAVLAALKPSTALADLVTAIDGLVGDSLAWDPFRDVRAPLDQLKADATAAAHELSPSTLLAPVLTSYATVITALAAIDVGTLFDRTLTALHALQSDVETALTAADSAFTQLQDALP